MKNKGTFVEQLLSILVDQEVVSSEESKALQKAFKESAKETFDDFLLEKGLVGKADLLRALAYHYKVPGFDVIGYFFVTHLLRMFPKGFLLRNACIPLEVDENIMVMVVSEPDNTDLLVGVGKHVSYDIRFRVGIRRDICDAIKEFYDKSFTEEPLDEDMRKERRLERAAERMEGKEVDFVDEEE